MKLRITVENRSYDVDVEVLDEVTVAAPQAVSAAPAKSAAVAKPRAAAPAPKGPPVAGAEGTVKAPIAGTVVSVQVKPGDEVAVNQVLLVLEAMKMETNIATPTAGRVKSVCVKPAEAVKAGQVLIELE